MCYRLEYIELLAVVDEIEYEKLNSLRPYDLEELQTFHMPGRTLVIRERLFRSCFSFQ